MLIRNKIKFSKDRVRISLFCLFVFYSGIFAGGYRFPYGVNSWWTAWPAQDLLKDAGIVRYRNVILWNDAEVTDLPAGSDQYNFFRTSYAITMAQRNPDVRVCLMFANPPQWAYDLGPAGLAQAFADYLIDMLRYCDERAPGAVDIVDIFNEELCWSGDSNKDPSIWYAQLLKTAYNAVKNYNPNILVMTASSFWEDGLVEGELHDQVYQLGCKGYFDRISFHYYTRTGSQTGPMDPSDWPWYTGSKYHYNTILRYLKFIAEQNGDNTTLISCTEYGPHGMVNYEQDKATYYQYILEQSRLSGFSDATYMYPGSEGYPPQVGNALIYCGGTGCDAEHPTSSTCVNIATTPAYNMYKSYIAQYNSWDPSQRQSLSVLTPASADAVIINSNFELGNTTGWSGATIDSSEKHSGNYSARSNMGTITSNSFTIESNRLYELVFWIKITGSGSVAVSGFPRNYDTSRYPGGWKRVRRMFLTTSTSRTISFSGSGSGTYWVDDISFKALNMGEPVIVLSTTPPLAPQNLQCNGEVNPKNVQDLNPVLSWRFNDNDEKDVQSAFRLIVADNTNDINNNIGNIWDTGKVNSVAIKYKYKGPTLQAGTTYYWKVKTWDYMDNEGSFSQTASFTTSGTQGGPVITVIYPNGGERWTYNTVQTVLWTSSNTAGNINIKLSVNGGQTWTALVSNTLNDGSQTVTVPDIASTSCRIRVETLDGQVWDMSNGDFTIIGSQPQGPVLQIDIGILDFGEVKIGEIKTLSFNISNPGDMLLTGTITESEEWIQLSISEFSINAGEFQTVDVTVDNELLNKREGVYISTITVKSNAGDTEITVQLKATCILVYPNPYEPEKGNLTFFGSGIVPSKTEIKVYTVTGEIVWESGKINSSEINWDGKNLEGKKVLPGIYIYTYKSPKESGAGKFTVK